MIMKQPETFKDLLYNMRYFVEQGEKILSQDLPYDDQKNRLETLSEECYIS